MFTSCADKGNRKKSPRKKLPGKNRPEKIPLNAVEREAVESSILTRVKRATNRNNVATEKQS